MTGLLMGRFEGLPFQRETICPDPDSLYMERDVARGSYSGQPDESRFQSMGYREHRLITASIQRYRILETEIE